MAFKLDAPTIIGFISVFFGIGLLITSCLILEYYSGSAGLKSGDKGISAGSLGLIASIIQIGSLYMIWKGNLEVWFGLHIGVFVLALIAFSLAANSKWHREYGDLPAFFGFSLVCWIWCILGGGTLFYLTKGKRNSNKANRKKGFGIKVDPKNILNKLQVNSKSAPNKNQVTPTPTPKPKDDEPEQNA